MFCNKHNFCILEIEEQKCKKETEEFVKTFLRPHRVVDDKVGRGVQNCKNDEE